MGTYILGIESSCDDTSAAVIKDNKILANITANQQVHRQYGGVVPELAARAHQQNIIPVVSQALTKAKIDKKDLQAIAFTRGPGLLGSLLVGTSFSKSMALGLGIPLIEVDHLEAHILAHFIQDEDPIHPVPDFPFLCLTVSGGHTLIVRVDDYYTFRIIGRTIDDAAGEAFDKAAKIMGLPYPGGPIIDRLALEGDPYKYTFPEPSIPDFDYSFSGLKTSFLYFIRDRLKKDPSFIENNKNDLAASIQRVIVEVLLKKLILAAKKTNISQIAIAGGVSANSELRKVLQKTKSDLNWQVFIPKFDYTTDNAAMIAIAGYYKYLKNDFAPQHIAPYTRSGQ